MKLSSLTVLLLMLLLYGCSDDTNEPLLRNSEYVLANFNADETLIQTREVVHFADISYGEPNDWNWTFEGGSPSTSNAKNPAVTYADEGSYQVTLKVSNGDSEDTKTVANFITVIEVNDL